MKLPTKVLQIGGKLGGLFLDSDGSSPSHCCRLRRGRRGNTVGVAFETGADGVRELLVLFTVRGRMEVTVPQSINGFRLVDEQFSLLRRIKTVSQAVPIQGTPYLYDDSLQPRLLALAERVREMRAVGRISSEALSHIRQAFRIKNIYHSNAIEGNRLSIGETREVVERGMTLTGQSLRDQAEAKNLGAALDFLEELATGDMIP
ncbi:hypothetical protein HZA57_05375, partial [Candidatus Poribacteria bacterium]|nr:hypothetical protein [Candidatus Poribacteria bacterium]